MSFLEFIKNGRTYTDKLTGDNDLNIFNIQLTNVYLDKYNELIHEHVTYNDITSITIFKNNDNIQRLPNNLKKLYIKSGTLIHLPISDEVARNIEVIFLDFTNIEYFPDISKCSNLKELTINHSNLKRFRPEYQLPSSLKVLNLRYNHISDVDFTILKTNPNLKINFSYNNINSETIDNIIMVNSRADIKMQNRYKFIRITHDNYNNVEIRNIMNNLMNQPNIPEQRNTLNGNVLNNNTQTVHLSSINKSIVSSYKHIIEYIDKQKLKINKDYNFVTTEIINEFNKMKLSDVSYFLKQKLIDSSNHSILQIKYVDLLCIVYAIIKTHSDHEHLMERFHTEIVDSNGMCFTGCMNRLINVLVGYIDGVVVSISLKEEIQMSILKIMDKLNNQQLNYKQTKEELNIILNQEYDVDKNDPNNIISDEYKKSWLVALNDFKPNAILCKIKQKIKVNDSNERMYDYYYIDYDDKIYDKEYDFDQEINPIGEIVDKDNLIAKIYSYEVDTIVYPEQKLTIITY